MAEVLVVTFLLAILVTLGVGIFLSNNKFYENESGKVLNNNATREAADRINEYTRAATKFAASRVYDGVNYATGATVLVLEIPAINSQGQIISGIFDYVIVAQDPNAANRLILIVDPHPSSLRLPRFHELTPALTSLSFTYDNSDLSLARKVDYTIKVRQTGRYPASDQIAGSASLRNK